MEQEDEMIIIDTQGMKRPKVGTTIYKTRYNFYEELARNQTALVSICVTAFNRIDKTKKCVESILHYTKEVDYELVLIDTGSTDEDIINYFQKVSHPKKKIVRISNDVGGMFGGRTAYEFCQSKYFVLVINDVYVTKDWLSNMLKCMESDPRVGFVTTKASNVSNLQDPMLKFSNYDEMQREAAKFNKSDRHLWEERLRLVAPIIMTKREVIDIIGKIDVGYYHDFAEDDFARRVRQAGYKVVLCGDTFVHHDHDVMAGEEKDPVIFQKSLDSGRENYLDKYLGLDPWEDINNYEVNLINMLKKPQHMEARPKILGVDVRCGTPILEIRNFLRRHDVFDSSSSAFTTQAKYYNDLQFVTDAHTICDRIEFLEQNYAQNSFDYIILGEPVNEYKDPISLLEKLTMLLKTEGELLFKLSNVSDVIMYLNMMGYKQNVNQNLPIYISADDIISCLKLMGFTNVNMICMKHDLAKELELRLKDALHKSGFAVDNTAAYVQLVTKEYLFYLQKK